MNNNAILLCGGVGARMAPIPCCNKSLLTINGELNIKRIIRILCRKGITDIVVAVNPIFADEISGRVSEISEELPNMNIKVVVIDEYFKGCNNIVTLRKVADFINNTYIIECDQYYSEEHLKFLRATPLKSSYLFTQPRNEDDWGIISDEDDRVLEILRDNPNCSHNCLAGIIYLTGDVSASLKDKLKETESNHIYWEELLDPKDMLIKEWGCSKKYSLEYDNISDLIDKKLMSYQDIANLIDDEGSAIKLNSMTNLTYKVKISGKDYALRLPGYQTKRFVNHEREKLVEGTIPTNLRPESLYYSNSNVKVTAYLEDYSILKNTEDIDAVMRSLVNIHEKLDTTSDNPLVIDLMDEIRAYEEIFSGKLNTYDNRYEELKSKVSNFLHKWFEKYPYYRVHRDLVPSNIMVGKDKDIKFIDWEYAGYLSYYWDIASFCCEYSDEYDMPLDFVITETLDCYPSDINLELLYCWIAVVDFVWSAWSLAKCVLGSDVLEYGSKRYERSRSFIDKYMKEV